MGIGGRVEDAVGRHGGRRGVQALEGGGEALHRRARPREPLDDRDLRMPFRDHVPIGSTSV